MNKTKVSKGKSNALKVLKNETLLKDWQVTTIKKESESQLPELLIITSFPPRECGIATYSQDLKKTISDKFGDAIAVKICALENKEIAAQYPEDVKYKLNTSNKDHYKSLAIEINADNRVLIVFLQHEFGLFSGNNGDHILELLTHLKKPVATTFHTILPNPDKALRDTVRSIAKLSDAIIVMTKNSKTILVNEYGIAAKKIKVVPHGTHLIKPNDTNLKSKVHLGDRLVLSTFGLISEGKNIETALEALPKIIKQFPNVLYLVIGKTHPEVLKNEGEKYRDELYETVLRLQLQNNVKFINKYLSLEDLIEYLQRTDIYLFTSKNPNQAVSGTLAYAMSCGCPIISTPIPHAKELLDGAGVNFDFQNSEQLADAAIELLYNPKLLKQMRLNALHKISPTAWENAGIAHVELAQLIRKTKQKMHYHLPNISLDHIKRLTTADGIIQFSKIAVPDLESGYTLDDNARALIAVTKQYQISGDVADLVLINTYLNFILYCQNNHGVFINYVDKNGKCLDRNKDENLEDSNGRAIWALGEFMEFGHLFNDNMMENVRLALNKSLVPIKTFHSPRAISFAIKGLYHYNQIENNSKIVDLITILADNLVSKYRGVSDENWLWYEDYLTYANSLLPEAMLYASMSTGSKLYKTIAKKTFDFLMSIVFKDNQIKVISNQGWHQKGESPNRYGEQPIDVAYTILALHQFYNVFKQKEYLHKMEVAFNWFLGKNHLSQIVYNPCTGGCYDGLEEHNVNLNQGSESTVSYLLARLTIEEILNSKTEKQLYHDSEIANYEYESMEVNILK